MLPDVHDPAGLLERLARGSEAARAEARRILDELVERGDVGAGEAAEIERAVHEAVEANRRWLDARVVGPVRRAAERLVAASREGELAPRLDALAARLEAIETRLARIEERLAAPGERPS